MKHLRLVALVILLLAITVFAKDWSRTFSLTGGSPQRLSTVITANGYTGFDAITSLDVLTVCNPTASTVTLYFGQSDVNASNGFPLVAGICYTWPPGTRPSDAQNIFLFKATTENIHVSIRSR